MTEQPNTDELLNQSAQSPVNDGASESSEKMLPQSKVDGLVRNAWQRGHEKGMAHGGMQSQPQFNGLTREDAEKIARDAVAKDREQMQKDMLDHQNKQATQNMLNSLTGKMMEAKKRIGVQDYDETVGSIGLDKVPSLPWLVDTVDNAGDVLYDLGKNPSKIGNLLALPPHLAVQEVKKLSNSIKQNQQANTDNMPQEPLGQFKASNVGTDKRPQTAHEHYLAKRGKY